MPTKVKEIIQLIEDLAPKRAAEAWDQVGLQLGGYQDEVNNVLVALEITERVLAEAIEKNIQMIIVHHPFLFKAVKRINRDDPKGKLIYQAILNNIAIYSAHTNIDAVENGLNHQLAEICGLEDIQFLEVTGKQQFYKLVVYVPLGHEEGVANALAQGGAGHIGNYSHCSFRTKGIGTFLPLTGANPFIGKEDSLERVEEIRLETIVNGHQLKGVITKMLSAHPYEEVAYDLYPLANEVPLWGIGRVGRLKDPVELNIYVEEIKALLQVDRVRVIGKVNDVIERVAIVNGSGAEYIQAAAAAGCDCLITGDVKYHDAQLALELGINVIDAGHYETEAFFVDWMCDYLNQGLKDKDLAANIIPSSTYINPFQYL